LTISNVPYSLISNRSQDWEDAYPALYEPTSVAAEAELLTEQVHVAQAVIKSAARAAGCIQTLKSTFEDELLVHGERFSLYGLAIESSKGISTWQDPRGPLISFLTVPCLLKVQYRFPRYFCKQREPTLGIVGFYRSERRQTFSLAALRRSRTFGSWKNIGRCLVTGDSSNYEPLISAVHSR
jgi:hypothetical protein